ncbi:MAG: aldo/keto reductase [Pseudomonadales bacterium]|nr:aldo/keto reductase [Pseudomonadales bacterium]
MDYRPLGATGITVSLLGLGTVKLGRDRGVRYPRPFRIPDDRDAARLLDCARELGINLLDTAPAYGTSEARLGRLLAGRRADWILCTKVGETFTDGVSRFDFTPAGVRASVARSLERLATDYLDIVLIHSDGRDVDILDDPATLDALRELKRAGVIRAVGISHKSPAGALRAIEAGCDVIMATLNPDYRDEAAAIARAGARGCGVLVKKALASGHGGPESLAFVAAQPGVSSIIVGTVDPAHLRENAGVLEAFSRRSGSAPRSGS